MPTRLSWKPINFRRWNSLALVLQEIGGESTANLSRAILGMKVSWERLGEDLDRLFLPSGPDGTHAAHHFHPPPDPAVREQVLAEAAADYETALMYLDTALQLSVEYLGTAAGQPYQDWKRLFRAAEAGDPGLATDARDIILYLQRTPLYVRNDAIVHPGTLLPVTTFDNVGNLSFLRLSSATPTAEQVAQLDELLHRSRPEFRDDAKVGAEIDPTMALNWLGMVSHRVDDWRLLNELRETFGFLLPGAQEIGPRVDAMVDHFIAVLPESDLTRIVFAAGPTASRTEPASEEVSAPQHADKAKVEALVEEGIKAGEAGDHDRAVELFRQCVQLDPEEGYAHFLLGQELISLDLLEEGLEYIYQARALGGADGDAIRRKLIVGHFNLGARYFKEREIPKSIPQYRRVVELDSTDLEAHRHLMEALAHGGDFDEAFWHAGKLLQNHAADPDVQLDIGMVFHLAENDELALHHVEKALEHRSEWERAIKMRDVLQRRLAKSKEDSSPTSVA